VEAIGLVGSVLGIGFVSGLNLYLTVFALGLAIRLGWIPVPPEAAELNALANTWVLTAAAVVFTIEFFADKIKWIDSIWDAIHTVIRPLGAAYLAYALCAETDPTYEIVLIILCGGLALASHTTKASVRGVANMSPEPFSNIVLSLLEDILALIGLVLAFVLPVVMIVFVCVFLVVFLWLLPRIFRLVRRQFQFIARLIQRSEPI
jgi:hypothetical protein